MFLETKVRSTIASAVALTLKGRVASVMRGMLDLVEQLVAEVARLREELQSTRDENNRLKGEQGKPTIRPRCHRNDAADGLADEELAAADRAAEQALEPSPQRQRPRRGPVPPAPIQRVEVRTVDREQVPADVRRAGTRVVRVRHMHLVAEDILFRCERLFSPSTGKTYQAPLPAGYQGGFSPHTKALAVYLAHRALTSEANILELFRSRGLPISAGTLAAWLADDTTFAEEYADILRAGIATGAYEHIDATSTRVNGEPQTCTVITNEQFTHYRTTPEADRLSVLAGLQGKTEVDTAAMTETAFAFLRARTGNGLSAAHLVALQTLPQEVLLPMDDFLARVHTILPSLQNERALRLITHGGAIAAYHLQTDMPIVLSLISDAAAIYEGLASVHGGCWVHEYRHYRKVVSVLPEHVALLARTKSRIKWFRRAFDAYRKHPNPAWADRLRRGFDHIFIRTTGFAPLDTCLRNTLGRRTTLLAALDHPELLLHNNPAELAVRRRVRKRDVSYGPRSSAGARAWDIYQTVLETATKQHVNMFDYLLDRYTSSERFPSLADLIRSSAAATARQSLPAVA